MLTAGLGSVSLSPSLLSFCKLIAVLASYSLEKLSLALLNAQTQLFIEN